MKSPESEHKLLAEQIDLLYKQAPGVLLGSSLSAALLVWLLWDEPLERYRLLVWLIAMLVVLILRFFMVLGHRTDVRRLERGAFWGWWFTVGAALSGVLWGYLGWSFFQPTLLFLFPIALVMAGQVALSVTTVGVFFPAHLVFNLLSMGPFMLRNFLEEGRLFHGQSIALLIFMIACLLFAWRQQETIRNAIRLRFANFDLLDRLTRENERADEARCQAETANAAKTRFLAAASHDLRQPLQAMTLFTHALTDEVQARRLPDLALAENLQSSCESLGMMLDSLLDLSRADVGALKVEMREFPLQVLFERIRREFADQAAAKGLRLRVVPTRAIARSDPALLERVLRNLTANALRYTEQGGILLGCRHRGDWLSIEVRDSGVGIPEELRTEIFREFYQLGNPERDSRKGLGLGLAIVDALARQMGHDITLRSAAGCGSTFAIGLMPGQMGRAAPMADPALPDRLRGRLLVVIDDEPMIRTAMIQLLTGWGCEVVVGESAQEVLAELGEAAPAAILADWRLREGLRGTDEVALIRARFGHAIPAILITGDTAPDVACNDGLPVIHKPVQGFRLRAQLDALLGNGQG